MAHHYDFIPIENDWILNGIEELHQRSNEGWRLVCMFTPKEGTQGFVIEKAL